MKFVSSIVLITLAGCASTPAGTQHFQVASDGSAHAKSNCSGPCDAHMSCTPDGHCVITCTDGAGQSCEVELACDGQGGCAVVRSDCSGASCCSSQAASKPVK
jgi:hypothetical protein